MLADWLVNNNNNNDLPGFGTRPSSRGWKIGCPGGGSATLPLPALGHVVNRPRSEMELNGLNREDKGDCCCMFYNSFTNLSRHTSSSDIPDENSLGHRMKARA